MNKSHFLNRFLLQCSLPEPDPTTSPFVLQTKKIRAAAVLIPLVERVNGLHMILTQRALHLKHHPGQISFPGGKYEESDRSLAFTAQRETEEEIGIPFENIRLLGRLASITSTSGFNITPYVAIVEAPLQLNIDQREVHEAFEVPCSFILNSSHFHKQLLIANTARHFTYCCSYKQHFIWGVTAQMIINLQQHLHPYIQR